MESALSYFYVSYPRILSCQIIEDSIKSAFIMTHLFYLHLTVDQ